MRDLSERISMIEGQLLPNGVTDKNILSAFKTVPRESFLLKKSGVSSAYIDKNIKLKKGHTMLRPLVLGKILELSKMNSNSRVLDIGCCTGYSSCIIAMVASHVVAVETLHSFVEHLNSYIEKAKLDNITTHQGPLNYGYEDMMPYDTIICEGRIDNPGDKLLSQLNPKGGKLFCISSQGRLSGVFCYKREDDVYTREYLFEANCDYLAGFDNQEGEDFVF